MWVQCPEKRGADVRRRQLVAAMAEIRIVEDMKEEKLAEN